MNKENNMDSFEEFMKSLIIASFFKKLLSIKPAKLEYSINKDGEVCAKGEGRPIERQLLTAVIIRDQVKKIFGSIDALDIYFDIMKKIIPELDKAEIVIDSHSSKEERDDFDVDIFKDMFKDLGL